jgi:hypothetical protein
MAISKSEMPMGEGSDISMLYREFADALTEVLAENAVGLARRGRPSYTDARNVAQE